MVSTRMVLIEDDYRNREDLASQLEKVVKRKVTVTRPPHLDEADEVLEDDVGLVIIDYELDMKDVDDTRRSYTGGTLLNKLREANADMPLVVISRRLIFDRYVQARDLVEGADLVFFKRQIDDPNSRIGAKLNALMDGFEEISGYNLVDRNWELLLRLLKANDYEAGLLADANPPIGPDDSLRMDYIEFLDDDTERPDSEHEGMRGWTAHEIGRWITEVLFKYPGILYNTGFAATSLGMALQSFKQEKVQKCFSEARYAGIFQGFDDFWWRGRLRDKAISLVTASDPMKRLPEMAVPWFQENIDPAVKPARCIFSDEDYADTICYIYNKPMRTRHSLVYYPDNRPSIMEPARVSFAAIEKSNRVKVRLFKRSDREVFKRIRSGEM